MVEKTGTPLERVDFLRASVIDDLRPLWITTVEELVTMAYDPQGREGLATALDMTLTEVDEMAERLLPLASQEVQAQIDLPAQEYGMGAWDEFEADQPRDLFRALDLPASLPPRVSLVAQMSDIRNQGTRGTCVAHACTAVREYMLGGNQVNLSEQFLYWAARQRLVTPILKNKPGSLLVYGMRALQEHGICAEVDWPYNPKTVSGNEEQGNPSPAVLQKARTNRIEDHILVWPRDIDDLKAHLAGGYPIAFTVPTFGYWNSITVKYAGTIRMPLSTDGIGNPADWLVSAHALCMVGYQDDEGVPGSGYFIIRNSWGTGWAAACPDGAGYAWLPYEYLKKYGLTAFTAV